MGISDVTGSMINGLLTYVTRTTLLAFTVLEVLVSILGAWFFFKYESVGKLGNFASKLYAWIFIFHSLCGLLGFYAAWHRKIRLTVIYYALFFINVSVGIFVDVPLFSLSCDCTSWTQCEALKGFANDGAPVLNPFIEPARAMDPHHRSSRLSLDVIPMPEKVKVLIETDTPRTSRSFLEEDESSADLEQVVIGSHRGMWRLKHHSMERSRHLGAHGADGKASAAEEALKAQRAARRKKASASALMTLAASHGGAAGDASAGGHNASVRAELQKQMSAFHYYIVTERDLRWVTTSEPNCQEEDVPEKVAAQLTSWQDEVHGKTAPDGKLSAPALPEGHGDLLTPALWSCLMEKSCGAVREQVVKSGEDTYTNRVCELPLEVKPSATKDPQEGDAKILGQVFFQKKQGIPKGEISRQRPQIFRQVFHEMDGDEVNVQTKYLNMVKEANDCMCDTDSCRAHVDDYGKTQFWCWLDEGTREACQNGGITLYKDDATGKLWTDDLCSDDCECSNQGLVPDAKQTDVNEALLWKNKLNYGSYCEKWHEGDPWEWCFTGFDSRCADRVMQHSTLLGIMKYSQFRSSLPCQRELQLANQKQARRNCMPVHWFVDLVVGAFQVLAIPMTLVIFKFIQNRCADEFEAEEQFKVASSDESYDEDPGTAGAGPRRSSGAGAGPRFSGAGASPRSSDAGAGPRSSEGPRRQ